MTTGTLNPRLAEIVEDFTSLPGKERLQLLLEFSDDLPALPERYAGHRDLLEQVPECQSPLFLAVEVDEGDAVHLFFDAPPEAPTTRGFAGILQAGLDGLNLPAPCCSSCQQNPLPTISSRFVSTASRRNLPRP